MTPNQPYSLALAVISPPSSRQPDAPAGLVQDLQQRQRPVDAPPRNGRGQRRQGRQPDAAAPPASLRGGSLAAHVRRDHVPPPRARELGPRGRDPTVVLHPALAGGVALPEEAVHLGVPGGEERPLVHVQHAEGLVRQLVVWADVVVRAPVEGDHLDREGAHVDGPGERGEHVDRGPVHVQPAPEPHQGGVGDVEGDVAGGHNCLYKVIL
eukprot:CAMPEP_0118953108 /NCGR_PEP_ID=MMETSP1169-20130426/55985_1 /TAXON_ID=36882 /ORGANISM="Pyramimonas obovata, Strain CCMP722" /LENGTH=209 /DNA_ID=CAMNT_0006900485 /DNA_START=125 /DNA_END=755 /DNA_ORIENTATION=+